MPPFVLQETIVIDRGGGRVSKHDPDSYAQPYCCPQMSSSRARQVAIVVLFLSASWAHLVSPECQRTENISVREWDPVTLRCPLPVGRPTQLVWMCPLEDNSCFGRDLTGMESLISVPLGRARVTIVQRLTTLSFEQINPSDQGRYRCILNETASCFDVQVQPHPLISATLPSNVSTIEIIPPRNPLKELQPATFSCRVTSPHAANFVWALNNEILETTSNVTLDGRTYVSQLSVTLQAEFHHAKLTCRVSFIEQTSPIEASLTLDVQYAPKVTIEPRYPMATVQGEITLACLIRSNPAVTEVDWLFENQPVPATVRATIVGNFKLKIVADQNSAAGEFRCGARNDLGTAISPVARISLVTPRQEHTILIMKAIGALAATAIGLVILIVVGVCCSNPKRQGHYGSQRLRVTTV